MKRKCRIYRKISQRISKLAKIFLLMILFVMNAEAYASGKITDIDGVKLYSEYHPNPSSSFKGTIVFINGSGTSMAEWTKNKIFFSKVKKSGSLFFYDRSGLGNSPPNFNLSEKNPITGKLISKQLFRLLRKNHIPAPYVVVAHSYGSIYAGYFVLKYHALIKALILVDPVPKDFLFSKKFIGKYQLVAQEEKKHSAKFIYRNYSGAQTDVIYQMIGFDRSKRELKSLGQINNKIPVVIISSSKMENSVRPVQGDWFTLQKQWLNHNPSSKIFLIKSGHFIQIHHPNIVANQITKVTKASVDTTPKKIASKV